PSAASSTGDDSFTYRVHDGSTYGNITVATITQRDADPWGMNAVTSIHHDSAITRGSLSGDVGDLDGDTLTFSLVHGPEYGSFSLASTGEWSYTPDQGFVGIDRFSWIVSDGISGSHIATRIIAVENERPLGTDATFSIQRGKTLNVFAGELLRGAIDPDLDSLSVAIVSGTAHGALSVTSSGAFSYTPSPGFAGDDQFVFAVTDGVARSVPLIAHISVENFTPVAHDAEFTTHLNTRLNTPTDRMSSRVVDIDADAVAFTRVSGPSHGTLTLEANGAFTYTPVAGFIGDDSFVYRASDGAATSSDAVVTLRVTNATPIAPDLDFLLGSPAEVRHASLVESALDPDGDPMSARISRQPDHGRVEFDANTGRFDYFPDVTFDGRDSFEYTVNDGGVNSNSGVVTIRSTNNPPRIDDQRYGVHHTTGSNSQATGFNVLRDAFDPDRDALTSTLVTAPKHGTVTLHPDGDFAYIPVPGFVGEDSFLVCATDTLGASTLATVTMVVTNRNPIPVADEFSAHHGQPLDISQAKLLSNDIDPDADPLSISIVSGPDQGTFRFDPVKRTYVFDPGNFVGETSFTYRVSDGASVSEPISATIRVENEVPHVWNTTLTLQSGDAHSGNLFVGSSAPRDVDGDPLTVQLVSGPSHGSLTLDPHGLYSYTPNAGFVGDDTFLVVVSDGVSRSEPFSVRCEVGGSSGFTVPDSVLGNIGYFPGTAIPLSVGAVPQISRPNSAPHAGGDGVYFVSRGKSVELSGILDNDSDPDGQPLSVVNPSVAGGGTLVNSADGLRFIAGSAVGSYSVRYQVSDGSLLSEPATIQVQVVNNAPNFADLFKSCDMNISATTGANSGFDYFGQDPDSDVTTVSFSQPMHGSLRTGRYQETGLTYAVYTPNPGYSGLDSYSATVSDGMLETTSRVTIFVIGSDHSTAQAPLVATDDTLEWTGLALHGNVLTNDGCLNGVLVTTPFQGNGLDLRSDGTFTFDLAGSPSADVADFVRNGRTFDYTIHNAAGKTATAHLRLTAREIRPGEYYSDPNTGTTVENLVSTGNSRGRFKAFVDNGKVHIQPTVGASFSIKVETPGAAALPVAWDEAAGSIPSLYLTTDGAIEGNLSADTLFLSAGGSVGNVSGATIRVSAGGDLGALQASKYVLTASAGGDIASISAGQCLIDATAGGRIGPVSSGGYIGSIRTGGNGPLSVLAISNIERVTAGGDISLISSAAGSIGVVTAGRDVVSPILAGGFIGTVTAQRDIHSTITAGGPVFRVGTTLGDISGSITSSQNIAAISAGRDLLANVSARNVVGITAGGSVSGDLAATGNLGRISANRAITGRVRAGENIGTVTGATGISSFEISAGGNIGAIETTVRNAAVHSALISAGNRIGAIRAAGSVEAAISAGTSIAVIAAGTAGTGDIRSTSIVAGTSIGTISALTGSIAADLTAARSIGEITAADDIDGHIHSGILSGLSALHGSISGTLTADESLGDVKAGSILSSVIHSFGNIGRTGVWDGGSISGDITAVGTIERIDAYCQTPGVAPANLELTEFSFQDHWNQKLAEISGQKQTTQPAVVAPSISTSAVVGGGDILSKIIAGGSIGAVAADGMIRDSIEAAKRIPIVAAGLDILGAITSDFGQTTIITLGRLIGGVISRGNVRAYSYKDLTSTMSSTEGSIKATSYGSITNARLTAFMNIYASSPFEFTGMASAQHGVAELCSMGDLGVNVFAEKDIIAAGEDLKNCRFTSAAGNVVAALTHAAALETRAAGTVLVTAISDIESAKIQGEYVSVYSLGSIRGTIAATTNIDVEIIGTANLNAASLHGNITVIAAGVKGTYATSGTENELGGRAGDIDLVAMGRGLYGDRSGGDLSAIVDAARNFHASALGEISGRADVKGRAEVSAFGDLTMKFTLATVMKPHELSSWQNVNADVVSGGAVDVFALNDCGGRITVHTNHDGSQPFEGNVNVVSYGWLSAEIESTDDVSVSGFQGIVSASIRAGDDIEAHSAGIVSTNMSAGDSKLLPDDQQRTSDSKANTLFVMSLGETTGKLSGANGVVVASHGGISSDISSTHGDVAVKALVSLGGGATDFSGNIDARKGSVVVKSSGNVTSPRIRGGDSVQIAAHNSISNCEITAMDGDVELNSDGSISNVKVAKAKDVALSAIKSIEAKVSAQGDAMLESRGRIKAAVETSAGSISVTSLGDVESDGTGFIAENDVTVTAFGEFRSARVVAKTGNATVFSREGLTNATISGTSGVDVASHQNVSNSTLTAASGVAFLSSLGGVTQTAVTGNYGASITSTRQIRAIINSDAGFASAVSSGDFLISDVDVRMTGAFGVAATSLAGAVSGTFNSSQGGARVTAAGTFKGTISAADGISVDAVESITIETVQDPAGPSPLSVSLGNTATQSNPSQGTATTPPVAAPPPTVNTRGDVSLSSFESITGTISAGGNIDAFAGGGLTGVITGRNVSAISRTGQVAATVTATGSAFVSALTRVTSSVTAGDDITVAALEAIEGNVTSQAGTATVESLLGSVTGAIQAGRDVNLFSFGSTPSSISAGRDANVKSMAAVIGTILAGRSATVEATGGIAESVTAGGDIEVDTLGQVSAPLSAGQDVDVVAWGGIESHISAGGNANVFSGGVTKGLVSAGEDADVFASGFLQIVINAAGDVSAMGGAALSVTATGGGNVDVTGRTTAMVDIHAGNWAQAFGLEKLQGFVVGGNFASASSLGILHADVTGGQDVTAFAVDAALGHYSGGQTASLISFGPAVD
ncbi:MAG: Ig-like domain-containing protein, partial [Planctomycetota bacterium]|nr:Ig-like domain-containing protein [Planctomycetota bacterium]